MREIGLIIRREFLERVRTRAFAIGTIAFPLFIVAIMLLPALADRNGDEYRIAVIDESGTGVGTAFATTLGAEPESTSDNHYVVEPVEGTLEEMRSSLNERVQAEDLDGYVVFPAELLDENRIIYRARNIANRGMLRDVSRAASRTVQAERMSRAGLDATQLATLLRNVTIDEARIGAGGEEGRGAESTFWFAYVVAFLVYFMTAFYGVAVLRSVLEEKTNRISEVLVGSVRSSHLMLGKILGVSAAALTQVGIWAAAYTLIATQSDLIVDRTGATAGSLQALTVPIGDGLVFLAYFTLGFIQFAGLFAALGAAVTTEQEANSMQMLVMVPLFIPLLFLAAIVSDPLAPLPTALGLFPLTAPVAGPMRLATAPIPPAQTALSLVLLALGVLAVAWIAGKIYRIGILSTGRRPTLKELGRWLREA